MRVNFLHLHLVRARLTAQFGSAQNSSLDSRLDDSARLGSRSGSALFEVRLCFVRDPALLSSRSGSALFEVRLCFVRGPALLCSRSHARGPARLETRIITIQGSGHRDSVWLGFAWFGSARLGLLPGTRFIWGLDSGPEALALGSEISSMLGSAQLRLNSRTDSGLATRQWHKAWLGSRLSSAHLDRNPARLISARLIPAQKLLGKQCTDSEQTMQTTMQRRKSARRKSPDEQTRRR